MDPLKPAVHVGPNRLREKARGTGLHQLGNRRVVLSQDATRVYCGATWIDAVPTASRIVFGLTDDASSLPHLGFVAPVTDRSDGRDASAGPADRFGGGGVRRCAGAWKLPRRCSGRVAPPGQRMSSEQPPTARSYAPVRPSAIPSSGGPARRRRLPQVAQRAERAVAELNGCGLSPSAVGAARRTFGASVL
jgi:hypothetical protein